MLCVIISVMTRIVFFAMMMTMMTTICSSQLNVEKFKDETNVELFTVDSNATKEENNSKHKPSKILRMSRGITIDSGAGNSVMPRRMVINKSEIRESEGSRAGLKYIAANDNGIPNEREYNLTFKTTEGNSEDFTFQIAEVNKALGAVSYLVDRGYKVTFEKNMKTGQDLSHMTNKIKGATTRFRREINEWVLEAYVQVDVNARR